MLSGEMVAPRVGTMVGFHADALPGPVTSSFVSTARKGVTASATVDEPHGSLAGRLCLRHRRGGMWS